MKISTKSFFSKLKSKSKALDNRESRLRRKQERLFKKAQDRRVTVSDFFGQDNEESAGATIKATMSNPLKIAESISKQKVTPRAEGGPIEEGKPYLVGEEGPEIIIPSKSGNVVSNDKTINLFKSLKEINSKLWIIEDEKRLCEKNADFGEKFVNLSRNVHLLNDERAKIKLEINNLTGSKIKEIKEYTNY